MNDAEQDQQAEATNGEVDLGALQAELGEQKKKAAEFYDQLLRARAEFDNFRRRAEKEKADSRLWGKQEVLMPLLQLVDVFEMALQQTEKATDVKQVAQGLEFLHKNFASFLKSEGIEALDVIGKPLDPLKAEVVEQVEIDDPDQVGHVISEVQKGYAFKGHVLRPSRVRVGVARKSE